MGKIHTLNTTQSKWMTKFTTNGASKEGGPNWDIKRVKKVSKHYPCCIICFNEIIFMNFLEFNSFNTAR